MGSYSQTESFGSLLLKKDPEDTSLTRIEENIEAYKRISNIDPLPASESISVLLKQEECHRFGNIYFKFRDYFLGESSKCWQYSK